VSARRAGAGVISAASWWSRHPHHREREGEEFSGDVPEVVITGSAASRAADVPLNGWPVTEVFTKSAAAMSGLTKLRPPRDDRFPGWQRSAPHAVSQPAGTAVWHQRFW